MLELFAGTPSCSERHSGSRLAREGPPSYLSRNTWTSGTPRNECQARTLRRFVVRLESRRERYLLLTRASTSQKGRARRDRFRKAPLSALLIRGRTPIRESFGATSSCRVLGTSIELSSRIRGTSAVGIAVFYAIQA